MKIGIIIAIERELKSFLNNGSEIETLSVGRKTVYRTHLGGHEVLAMLSGYGEIDAAAATQLLITWGGCETVLNFGVTGALDPALRVEDLFVVRRVCHYDYDVSPIDPVKKHQYEEFPDEFIPLDDGLLRRAKELMPELREAAVASGDRFIEERSDKEALRALGCDICDMEIAAIARVCALNGIPCLSVKCISDTYDGTGADFVKNVTASAEKAFRVLLRLLEGLPA